MKKIVTILLAFLIAASFITFNVKASDDYTILFVMAETPQDLGWNYAHDRELLASMLELGKIVEKSTLYYKVETPEGKFLQVFIVTQAGYNPPSIEETIRKAIIQNEPDMVIGSWFNSAEPLVNLSKKYPDIKFLHISGYPFITSNNTNLATAFIRMEWGDYVMGYIVGLMGIDKAGLVLTYLIPEPVRGVNGFIKGMQDGLAESGKDPQTVKVYANLINSWLNAQLEQLAASDLLGRDLKVIRQMSDTPYSSLTTCQEAKDAFAVGYGSDAQNIAPCEIGANEWGWRVIYTDQIRKAMNGVWEPIDSWLGFPEGAVRIVFNTKLLPLDIRLKAEQLVKNMTDGRFNPFCGPIFGKGKDVNGAFVPIIVPTGKCLSDMDQLKEQWFIEGYEGEYPTLPENFKLELVDL